MATTYLTDKKVAQRYGVSRPTVWRWLADHNLPTPVRLSPGCTRWRLADLETWEAEQANPTGAKARCG